jgi:hypothetical protein
MADINFGDEHLDVGHGVDVEYSGDILIEFPDYGASGHPREGFIYVTIAELEKVLEVARRRRDEHEAYKAEQEIEDAKIKCRHNA